MLRLATPIVFAELGWMGMGVVDTMMVGRLSPEAIGAVSLGTVLFYTLGVFGVGMLLGLDTLVSQAFGAGDLRDCHRSLFAGIHLSLPLTPLLMGVVWVMLVALPRFGINPAVLRDAGPYLSALNWSTLPLLLYSTFRRYLQAMDLPHPVMFTLITANLVNVFGNWLLIYGNLGAPAMGTEGSGWATCVSRVYMAAVLAGYILYHDRRRRTGLWKTPLRPDVARIRRLLSLGLPAASQLAVEMAVFAVVTALISRLDPASLAGHQIALNVVSVTYMVPLGIGAAAAVRVGQAIGRGDPHGAAYSGWTALALGAAFMFCCALAFWIVPYPIARAYTPDPAVIRTAVSLLAIAAFFQLFDGVQTVATGALRGAGDTRTPMLTHLTCYWLIGLPLGYTLCFHRGWGAAGLWAGLSTALILIGIVLLLAWRSTVRSISAAYADYARLP